MDRRRIAAGEIISHICDDTGYTRSHVARLMRENARILKARRRNGRWTMPPDSIVVLHNIVVGGSGPRYKLGERGRDNENRSNARA